MMRKHAELRLISTALEGYFCLKYQTGVPEHEPLPDEEPEHTPDKEPITIPVEPEPKPDRPAPEPSEPDLIPAAIN
jgi:hypothetical protein